jgi:Holliday junction DNA helicase RuvB
MEDYKLDIIIGKGPSAKSIRIDISPFTIIGATTRTGLLGSPLRDRIGVNLRLDYYNVGELIEIILRSARILGISVNAEGAVSIAKRSRGTPRIANRLLKRVRDHAISSGDGSIDFPIAEMALTKMDIDILGLDVIDKKILDTIINKFGGGPVGVGTIAISIGEEVNTIEDVYEPYLVQIGFIKRTPKGRLATELAYKHMKVDRPAKNESLF